MASHVYSPLAGDQNTIEDWNNSMASAKAQLDSFAGAGRTVRCSSVGTTTPPNMRQFRDLLTNGYRDAVEQTGSGFGPTFRADIALPLGDHHRPCPDPQRLRLDGRTITVQGSDHRSLLVTVQVPMDAGS